MQGWLLFFQRVAVPFAELRSGVVSALGKIQQGFVRRFSIAHRVVGQDELAQFGLIKSRIRPNFRF